MSTILLFVTAKMPVERINKLLSEHQTLDDDIPDSLFALVRDRTVSLADLDDNTEPPVEEFESGFIGATDEQLWSTLPEYHKEDNKGGKAIHIDPHLLVLLDEISVTNNTIRMLYNPDHGETKDTGRQAWRVDFLYVWGVTPHLQRINTFLSEHQTLDDVIPNSIYALIRDRNVSVKDIDNPGTEPPVEDFESGFLGATDDELWRTVEAYSDEDRIGKAAILDRDILVVLDDISASEDTIRMLYNPRREGKHKQAWRVDFLYVWGVTPYLPDQEEIYMNPDNRDEDGVIDMQKTYKAKGVDFPPDWRKLR